MLTFNMWSYLLIIDDVSVVHLLTIGKMALRLAASVVPRTIFRSTLPSVTRLCKFSAQAQVGYRLNIIIIKQETWQWIFQSKVKQVWHSRLLSNLLYWLKLHLFLPCRAEISQKYLWKGVCVVTLLISFSSRSSPI